MTTKTLIRGGTVVSMDPQIGDLTGDVLIEDDKIVAVEPNISADADVIDATDCIVIPGFVDTHRHTWEAAIRGCAPNATLDDYFVEVLDTFAPVYRPEDVYASNVAGSLECLNAGITTLVDWSHINNTPDHPDAAITGLQETGIRAQYAYGSANLSLADYWFNSKIAIPDDDVRRVRDTYFSSDDGLLTHGPGHPRQRLLHGGGRSGGVGTRPGAGHPDHGARRDGPARRPVRHDQDAERLRAARARHDLRPLLPLQRRGMAARQGHRRQGLGGAAGGAVRWATAGRRCCSRFEWGCGPACPSTW